MSEGKRAPFFLIFQLKIEEGWPPVSVECLPCEADPGGYRVLVAPLFVKDLSVGDVIEAQLDTEGTVESWCHVVKSGHTTVWLLRLEPTDAIPSVLARLRELGCSTLALEAAGAYSIDVPESVPLDAVDAVLEELDSGSVAAVFPSLRHAE